jgi:hypothetical protein
MGDEATLNDEPGYCPRCGSCGVGGCCPFYCDACRGQHDDVGGEGITDLGADPAAAWSRIADKQRREEQARNHAEAREDARWYQPRPGSLVDAKHERVHRDVGRSRPARVARPASPSSDTEAGR